jgi:hypothetical protein
MGQQDRQFGQSLGLSRDNLAQQDRQFGQGQQLSRDAMLQQLAMFFGLPTGVDIGAAEMDMDGPPAAGYGRDGVTYTTRPTTPPFARFV